MISASPTPDAQYRVPMFMASPCILHGTWWLERERTVAHSCINAHEDKSEVPKLGERGKSRLLQRRASARGTSCRTCPGSD